ncbi:hypothetical protein GCM10007416_35240 [Kroppenstedtia guangzhouensis]|uniref:TNase-like domain-containing protein n=1 Tax=Kroppenstedtia guangzhouensis TaxID=1274356 RepID=A0ABQ1H6I4_9BACL|nr:thermonuclease family protein [Kroppenstedtia guangzhouensis]GGA59062.1 hypothetical protein GCM10007416_35240 [Kroppenstedtia guangzhouensis]
MRRSWIWLLPLVLMLGCKDPNQTADLPIRKIVEEVEFVQTLDGDEAKFRIDGDVKTVQFLQVESPSIDRKQPLGEDAMDLTDSLLKNAKKIELRYDVHQGKSLVKAYVFADGTNVQKELLKKGLARKREEPFGKNRENLVNDLQATELEAQEKQVGIWACPGYVRNKDFAPEKWCKD